MFLQRAERVSMTLPQEQVAVIISYFGWMSAFIMCTIKEWLRRHRPPASSAYYFLAGTTRDQSLAPP